MKVAQSSPTLCKPKGDTVHGILQARILEWVAFPFCRGSSQPRFRTQLSHIAGRLFTSWATREDQEYWSGYPIPSPVDLPDPGIEPGSPALQMDSFLFFLFYFILLYNTVLVLPYINMNPPRVYMSSQSFSYDPMDAGNLISGSSAFSKSSLNIWNFTVHILLKPSLENFESSLENQCSTNE